MNVAVIGAGPAGLMAAEVLAQGGARVTVYDQMASAGRKFLLAGRGGLNLTHSEPLERFMTRYGEAAPRLNSAIGAFPPDALRAWSEALGQQTFVGSSGRVFPEEFKASPLLRAWLRRLNDGGVRFAFRHRWCGWTPGGELQFDTADGRDSFQVDATVIALGGASWPRLGSDGGWIELIESKGIAVSPLRPANCGFSVAWTDLFRERFSGQPLKNIRVSFGALDVAGEAMVTRSGIEGGAIYAMAAHLRDAIILQGEALLHIALRPDLDASALLARLSASRQKQSLSTFLRKQVGLSPVGIAILQEAAIAAGLHLSSLPPEKLAVLINSVPLRLTGVAPIERAISTAGGLAFDEIDEQFMLRKMPGTFVAGEMLDWEAPTGGYLLQASFATGAAAGRGALAFLGR